MSSLSAMTDRVGGDGGAICISPEGSIGIEFNSTRMAWAYIKLDECQDGRVTIHSGIYPSLTPIIYCFDIFLYFQDATEERTSFT